MTAPSKAPVLFAHGLWLHGSSWEAWMELFREAGYKASAPGWPGDSASPEEQRANADRVAGHGIDDIVAGYVQAIGGLGSKPIVIGHSFGGFDRATPADRRARVRGRRHRRRPDQGSSLPAGVDAARRVDRPAQSRPTVSALSR